MSVQFLLKYDASPRSIATKNENADVFQFSLLAFAQGFFCSGIFLGGTITNCAKPVLHTLNSTRRTRRRKKTVPRGSEDVNSKSMQW